MKEYILYHNKLLLSEYVPELKCERENICPRTHRPQCVVEANVEDHWFEEARPLSVCIHGLLCMPVPIHSLTITEMVLSFIPSTCF